MQVGGGGGGGGGLMWLIRLSEIGNQTALSKPGKTSRSTQQLKFILIL